MTKPEVDPRFAQADPLFFVIGAQKSGTTWLQSYFSWHPEVCVPYWKELNYWPATEGWGTANKRLNQRYKDYYYPNPVKRLARLLGLRQKPPAGLKRGVKYAYDAYRNPHPPHTQYADAIFDRRHAGSRAFGEVCPQYALLSPQTYATMAQLAENVKFVYLMRDPLARTMSAVKHGLRFKDPSIEITEAMRVDAVEKALLNRRSWGFDKSDYAATIARLESVIADDSIRYVFYENMFSQPEMDGLCGFLGVQTFKADFDRRVNTDTHPSVRVPVDLKRQVVAALDGIYAAMDAKFGAALPQEWRASWALLDAGGRVDA